MTAVRRLLGAVGAVVALLIILVVVPVLLVRLVGNPWPGANAVRLGDQQALLTGVLAAAAWVLWARFGLAVAVELPAQWREVRADHVRPPDAPPELRPPHRTPAGVSMIAARLVGAALVILPFVLKAPVPAAASPALLTTRVPAAHVVDGPSPALSAASPDAEPPASVRSSPPAGAVNVARGDTLLGLARAHLGDSSRWREIFELNRDRPQQGGQRLTSPSSLQPGWTLLLPGPVNGTDAARATGEPAEATAIVVEPGDTLWDLTHDRLAAAGWAHDDASVVDALRDVVAANRDEVDDPDVIFAGQEIDLPALGAVPPPAPPDLVADPGPVIPPVAADAAFDARSVLDQAADGSSRGAPTAVGRSPDGGVPSPSAIEPAATSTTTEPAAAGAAGAGSADAERGTASPSPVGLGEAALLSTGVLALLLARRRQRLRAAVPRARVPEPSPEHVTVERALRSIDGAERVRRLDVAVRSAAAALLDARAQPAVICVGADGRVELALTGEAVLPAPWQPADGCWVLPGTVPVELIGDAARRVGTPCVALTQLGVDVDGREVFVDLEALGALGVHGPDEDADAVVRGIAATLATSGFAAVANLVGVGLDELAFLDHRGAHHAASLDEAVELATTLIGTTASAPQSTFVLRARHTSGEAWEPAVVLASSARAHEVTPELMALFAQRRAGVALVAAGDVPDAPWWLRQTAAGWSLEPIGITLTTVGLSTDELEAVYEVLHEAEVPLVFDQDWASGPVPPADPAAERSGAVATTGVAGYSDPPWRLLVRVLGGVDVIDEASRPARFERSKSLELIAWLALHRDRSTRAGARTALWDLDVRDATFANVVSEARRTLARHVAPPEGEEWIERTLTERLPLHALVLTDADLVRARLDRARVEPPQQAIETLRPAVELVRGTPFTGTGYLWPDPEGVTSNLVLLATSAATELAGHYLSMGDVDGVFWATSAGLQVLPGHEELIALRMRAHHRAGDLAGVRLEWESYERVLDGDQWGDGEPAPKLVTLRRELLRPAS